MPLQAKFSSVQLGVVFEADVMLSLLAEADACDGLDSAVHPELSGGQHRLDRVQLGSS